MTLLSLELGISRGESITVRTRIPRPISMEYVQHASHILSSYSLGRKVLMMIAVGFLGSCSVFISVLSISFGEE